MQKTKKQLLGFVGLATVGIMTAVAYAMPAAAAEDEPLTGTGDVNVVVTVPTQEGSGKITLPVDGRVETEPETEIAYMYNEIGNAKLYIEYKDQNNNIVRKLLDDFTPDEPYSAGERRLTVNLLDYSEKENDYKLILQVTNREGASTGDDIVTFSYRVMTANFEKKPASNGDPILNIDINSEVDKVYVYIYDKNGEPLITDEDGNEVPVLVNRDDIDPATGLITKVLPFAENEAANGKYTAVVVAYNAKGNIISMVSLDTEYTFVNPDLPETPNTGFTIGDLNISRVDYLITGLIVFGVVAGFALYLVYRKSRR